MPTSTSFILKAAKKPKKKSSAAALVTEDARASHPVTRKKSSSSPLTGQTSPSRAEPSGHGRELSASAPAMTAEEAMRLATRAGIFTPSGKLASRYR